MHRTTLHVTVTTVLLLISAWEPADADRAGRYAEKLPSDVAWMWFEGLYDIVKQERTSPPEAARVFGIASVALYESIVPGTKRGRSLVGQLNGLVSMPPIEDKSKYHWPLVANAALAATVSGLYPTISPASLAAINDLEGEIAAREGEAVPRAVYERSITHGRLVAAAVLDWAADDGFDAYDDCPYRPVPGPGAWEPTPPAFDVEPLQPCWGRIRPMVLESGDECAPPGPPAFSGDPASEFHASAMEVYEVALGLTREQQTIAHYWSDAAGATGTPAGHWIAILSQIARRDGLSLATAAEAYARVGLAMHDAFIASWSAKFSVNLQRPVTYINDHIDASWTPLLVTPDFPSYTSGHATQSGAAAEALTQAFGPRGFTDTTHVDHGLAPPLEPRTFTSFAAAAAEAAVSRLYGGIHYAFDNEDGFASGQCVGQAVGDRVTFGTARSAVDRAERRQWTEGSS